MFDVSFSELVVIFFVALLVIGPEKLPKVARTLGALAGRMQRYIAQVKEEVNRESRFQELQELQQEIQETVSKATSQVERSIHKSLEATSSALIEQDLGVENVSENAPKNAPSLEVLSLKKELLAKPPLKDRV